MSRSIPETVLTVIFQMAIDILIATKEFSQIINVASVNKKTLKLIQGIENEEKEQTFFREKNSVRYYTLKIKISNILPCGIKHGEFVEKRILVDTNELNKSFSGRYCYGVNHGIWKRIRNSKDREHDMLTYINYHYGKKIGLEISYFFRKDIVDGINCSINNSKFSNFNKPNVNFNISKLSNDDFLVRIHYGNHILNTFKNLHLTSNELFDYATWENILSNFKF